MRTKIMYVVFMLVFITSAGIAQNSKTSLAILGGVNFQNFTGKDFNGNSLDNDLILGFHAGINAQIPIAPEFYFQPGLLFSTKGSENTEAGITSTYNLSYVEVPLNLVYKGALGSGFIMVGLGPYVAYGITGKSTHEGPGSIEVKRDVKFQNDVELDDSFTNTYIKPLDIGGNIFAGYEMASGIFIQLNSHLGLVKINPDDKRLPDGETSINNIGFGLSLGYRFL